MAHRTQRQNRLLEELAKADRPLTGSELATRCKVTRQVVVHDVAIIRASGVQVLSTPRGYWLQSESPRETRVLSVCHPPELTEIELMTLVDFGIEVLDVMVEHPIYGELRGGLHLSSRRDVELFMEQVRTSKVTLLSSLTDGFHLHTVAPPHSQRLQEAIAALRQNGVQVFEEESQ
ncbi:transcription repressor NadR [Alicyclobacillus sp. SO9]|uniref:transcription repressor NadR n=1 Tax=Alicyclobacillus sp. SO9 TaxID=2665646 RepID=UPI0018E72F4B|nr:transcription repressor NadR [Alicyclobacillus sp. SO9]QQE77777.1 transcription repressor NadR [Alicyclobacillus sp. SO9]